ncbi:metal ABC transporter solute-binding protein, Zn/Mn family [Thalassococcus sp. BH17M4-6]|uniref:metal ABC transporter solute-binding protein, Zn/Mn family n=1 Tax=Thalassococcus sp. BH17M4-6 TaxID=3413148 RepID=UPI003BD5F216
MILDRRTLLTGLAASALVGALPGRVAAAETLNVVATTGMIGDAARAIGGDAISLSTLMGPGVDPHSYRQTRTDIVALSRADVVLWNGLYLEAQMEDFLLRLGAQKPVVPVAEALPDTELLRHADYEGRADPHIWMVPDLWQHAVGEVRDTLMAARPDAADSFASAADAYLADLAAVGDYARATLAQVPEDARVLVTAHDAFGYFGRAYGFEVMGIQGISTESEAGLQRIGALVDTLVNRRIKAVFVESSVSDRNIRALIEGAAAQGHEVVVGGELFSDAMGVPGTYEGTYVGMIDHNATVIARALGADVAPRGMTGKLSAGL